MRGMAGLECREEEGEVEATYQGHQLSLLSVQITTAPREGVENSTNVEGESDRSTIKGSFRKKRMQWEMKRVLHIGLRRRTHLYPSSPVEHLDQASFATGPILCVFDSGYDSRQALAAVSSEAVLSES